MKGAVNLFDYQWHWSLAKVKQFALMQTLPLLKNLFTSLLFSFLITAPALWNP